MPTEIQRLLARRVGLSLAGMDLDKAGKLLAARAGGRFPSPAAYLASLSQEQLVAEAEYLAARLTPGETYFFRDHGQFDLLRFRILPELIEHRRRWRTLRLWSAGCASGEEAYSLAMLVDMALPEWREWRVSVVGSDINGDALERARRASYGRWSFRMAPADLQARYFTKNGDHWIVDKTIRSMVTFLRANLLDPLPAATFRDQDLILCRNVFVYFTEAAVGAVAARLAACLAEGGYLVTGHTELTGQRVPGLHGRIFPEGVVYRKAGAPSLSSVPVVPKTAAMPQPTRSVPPPPSPASAPAAALGDAQALADQGDYQGAEAVCRKGLGADPLQPGPHFLLAQLAQLRGDYREAEARLIQTLYLAPGYIAAHLELAALHERAGDSRQALARRRAALDLLRRLPAEAGVEPFGVSAGQMADWLATTEDL